MRLRSVLTALGLNAVPAWGWFVGEWSAGTMLVLYWLETLIGTVLLGCLIIIHRRIRPSKGHWDYHAPQGQATQTGSGRSTYLTAFLVPAVAFTVAHGIFLAALGFIAIKNNLGAEARVNVHDLVAGLIGIALFQSADFISDLIWLRDRPFAWIEKLGQITFARLIVVHLTIIGGMAAVMFTGATNGTVAVSPLIVAVTVPAAVSTPFTSDTLVIVGMMLILFVFGAARASGRPLVIDRKAIATPTETILFLMLIIFFPPV